MRGLHHLHLRKRKTSGTHPYPAKHSSVRLLDRVVLIGGIIGPIAAFPQALKIYMLHDASGVSMLAWLLPAIFDIPWILYGVVHRERPIFVTYLLWFAVNLSVAIGTIIYGSGSF